MLAELGERVGFDAGVRNERDASQQLFDAVPFYGGMTLEELGGRGARWQEREQASAFSASAESGADGGQLADEQERR